MQGLAFEAVPWTMPELGSSLDVIMFGKERKHFPFGKDHLRVTKSLALAMVALSQLRHLQGGREGLLCLPGHQAWPLYAEAKGVLDIGEPLTREDGLQGREMLPAAGFISWPCIENKHELGLESDREGVQGLGFSPAERVWV